MAYSLQAPNKSVEGAQHPDRDAQLAYIKSDLAAPLRVVDAGSGRRESSKILARHVRGSFFVEYVRMIRRRKDVDWMGELRVEDLALVQQRIVPEAWYPMASFERLGLAILGNFPGAGLEAVRMWGNYSAHQFVRDYATLLADGDPVETLMRLRVQRATLFDFPAFDIPTLIEGVH